MENEQQEHAEILRRLEKNAKHVQVVYGLSIIAIALVLTVLAPKIIRVSTALDDQAAPSYITQSVEHKDAGGESVGVASTSERKNVVPY